MLTMSANVSAEDFAPTQDSVYTEAEEASRAGDEAINAGNSLTMDNKAAKALTDAIDKEQSKKQ